MATSETYEDILRNQSNRTFTFSEAIEFQKRMDRMPTPLGKTLSWVDSKTKKHVYIGYTSY